MKTAICSLLALFVGVAIGYFGKKPVEVEKEKVVEKIVEKEYAGTPVTIKAVDNIEDQRFNKESPKNTVMPPSHSITKSPMATACLWSI